MAAPSSTFHVVFILLAEGGSSVYSHDVGMVVHQRAKGCRRERLRGHLDLDSSRNPDGIYLFVFSFFRQTSRLVLSQIRFLRNCDSGSLGYLGLLELSVRLEIELLSRQIDSFRGIDFLKGINSNEGMGS